MAIMDFAAAKRLVKESNVVMPWEKGHDKNVETRSPKAAEEVKAITEREEANLDEAQQKVLEQIKGKVKGSAETVGEGDKK